MSVRTRFIVMACLVLAAATAGTAREASAAEQITIATVGKGQPPEWATFIANSKGFFAENGVSVDLVVAQSAAAATLQVAAGSAQMSVGGMTEVMLGIDHGAKLKLLRIETQVPPYSLFAKKTIQSIKDLRGKIVSVGGANDVTLIYFERMASANGLKRADYDLVYAGTTPARYAALASGSVDAAILYPPGSFEAATQGYPNIGNLSDYVKDMPFTGFAVDDAWAAKNKPAVVGFLKGLRKAIDWFYDVSHRDEAVTILVKESGQSQANVEKTYDYYRSLHIYPEDGTIDATKITSLVQALAQMGTLAGPADPKRFVSPEMAQLNSEAR
jgi:ABC-type nitrate/sulfonate/bicarbonate transport system substrate-binding protein